MSIQYIVYDKPTYAENWQNYLMTQAAVNSFFNLPNAAGTTQLTRPLSATDGIRLIVIFPDALLDELPEGLILGEIPGLGSDQVSIFAELPDDIALDYGVDL